MTSTITRAGTAILAGMYLYAADRIADQEYKPLDDCEQDRPGISVHTALMMSAQAHISAAETAFDGNPVTWSVSNLADELRRRLAAVLCLTGQVTTSRITDMTTVPSDWEHCYWGHDNAGEYGYPSQDEAITLLKTAAALISAAVGPVG